MRKFVFVSLLLLTACASEPIVLTPLSSECAAQEPFTKTLLVVDMRDDSGPTTHNTPLLSKQYMGEFLPLIDTLKIDIYHAPEAQIIPKGEPAELWPSVASQVVKLNQKVGAHYVLAGSINVNDDENTFTADVADALDFHLLGKQKRFTKVTWQLFDGLDGSLLKEASFNVFDEVARVNMRRPEREGLSPTIAAVLGETFLESMQSQANYIIDHLTCLPLNGLVVKQLNDGAIVNIGISSGIKVGDRLTVARADRWNDYRNENRGAILTTINEAEVVAVSANSAKVVMLNTGQLLEAELGDVVTTQK